MHTMKIFAVYDRKAAYYLPTFQARTEVDAIRSFTDAIMGGETPLAKYPADYDLILLADMDTETGQITPRWPVNLITNGYTAYDLALKERGRYAKALDGRQMDLEEMLAEES